jgi:hypothetical protein
MAPLLGGEYSYCFLFFYYGGVGGGVEYGYSGEGVLFFLLLGSNVIIFLILNESLS